MDELDILVVQRDDFFLFEPLQDRIVNLVEVLDLAVDNVLNLVWVLHLPFHPDVTCVAERAQLEHERPEIQLELVIVQQNGKRQCHLPVPLDGSGDVGVLLDGLYCLLCPASKGEV